MNLPNIIAETTRLNYNSRRIMSGVNVVYIRKGGESLPLKIVPGRNDVETLTNQGVAVRSEIRDWIVLTEELAIEDEPFEPKLGDRIEISGQTSTKLETYDVAPLTGRDRVYQWGDPNRVTLRVHSRRTKIEPIPVEG